MAVTGKENGYRGTGVQKKKKAPFLQGALNVVN